MGRNIIQPKEMETTISGYVVTGDGNYQEVLTEAQVFIEVIIKRFQIQQTTAYLEVENLEHQLTLLTQCQFMQLQHLTNTRLVMRFEGIGANLGFCTCIVYIHVLNR